MVRRRAALTKATAVFSMNFKYFVTLTPEQPCAGDVTHIRDERKVHARVKKRTLQEQDRALWRERMWGHQQCLVWEEQLARLSLAAGQLRGNVNLIKKGIVKSSSDSGCETMLSNPNNFYSNQLSRHEELRSKVGEERTSWHNFVNPKSCCRQNWKIARLKNNYVSL